MTRIRSMTKPPEAGIFVVRTDPNTSLDYDFYRVTVEYVGSAQRLGTRRIRADDGREYSTLNDVADLYENAPARKREAPTGTKVAAVTIIGQGKWVEFCRMADVDPKDPQNMQSVYVLQPRDIEKLGLEVNA